MMTKERRGGKPTPFSFSLVSETLKKSSKMTYVKTNVLKPGDNKGAGGNKKDLVILFDMDDVATFPDRDPAGVVIADNIVFKPNAYMVKIYATVTTITGGDNSEGDLDAQGFVHNLVFDHPGSSQAIREAKQNWIARNMGALVQKCGETTFDLYGTPCAPLILQTKWEDTKDKNIHNFTFKSLKNPYSVAIYQGTTTFDVVNGTAEADATTVDVASGSGQYQLTDGGEAAATLTTLSNPSNGGMYTLLGSGGAHPSLITSANDFILAGGVSWTAIAGATITFKAFQTGVSTWKFIEQSRS
jgi:hypothetical protein